MSYLEGDLLQVLFYNEENSYSVVKIEQLDTDEPLLLYKEPTVIVCGFFPRLEKGSRYKFYGSIKEHPKYGRQFDATKFERVIDYSKDGLIDYLSSDLFKGIGPKTAKSIVDELGTDAVNLILNHPDILDKIPRMNETKKAVLLDTLVHNRKLENSLVWLYGFQISPKMAMKIYQAYGATSIDVIKENPYTLMDDIEGIGFRRADEIALKIGFEYNHPLRIRAVILYLLNEYMNKYGDTFVLREQVLEYTLTYLNSAHEFEVNEDEVLSRLEDLIFEGKIIEENHQCSLSFIYFAERSIASNLKYYSSPSVNDITYETILATIHDFESMNGIDYNKEQLDAIVKALTHPFLIITGGPGTGKTTIIHAIVSIYKLLYGKKREVLLSAPTGKAAKRLKESSMLDATTIHRMLGYNYEGSFTVDAHSPLDADLIIIDEVSMLDTMLAKHLFESIRKSTKLILVGDQNQLPSVGPGQVLSDLIASNLFETVELHDIHRQAKDSSIISLAYDILNQHVSENLSVQMEDRRFIKTYDSAISERIVTLIKEAIKAGYSLQDDIQVLIPIYKGQNGIDHINQVIQEHFNGIHKAHKISFKEKTFYFKDKVLQLVNQPEDGVMNGDIGEVISVIEEKEMLVDFSGTIVKYDAKDLDNLTLAYAVSIHKAQGSEFKVVILPLIRSYLMMLKRKLLYTAVTRAKEHLVMIGDYYIFERGVRGIEKERNTRLKSFLEEEILHQDKNQVRIEDFL